MTGENMSSAMDEMFSRFCVLNYLLLLRLRSKHSALATDKGRLFTFCRKIPRTLSPLF